MTHHPGIDGFHAWLKEEEQSFNQNWKIMMMFELFIGLSIVMASAIIFPGTASLCHSLPPQSWGGCAFTW